MMKLNQYKIVFWDFDGVIKESVNVKTDAFVTIFEDFGTDLTERVKAHHIANGGMSRFEKIPLYAEWAGIKLDDAGIQRYSDRFSEIAVQKVIDSPWIPGVEVVLRRNQYNQIFVLVSATPDTELRFILDALQLSPCFQYIFGSPVSKKIAISQVLEKLNETPKNCIMIGDAKADFEAALANNIDFLLRIHDSNEAMKQVFQKNIIKDFTEYGSVITNK